MGLWPRRRQALNNTEELWGRGAKEELPECWGGTESNLGIAYRSNVPRFTTREKILLMNCERPLDMEYWREMTRERQRETFDNSPMDCYVEEKAPAATWGGWVETTVSSKPPPPKAPIAYWQDLSVESAADPRKGKDPDGGDSEGKDPKGEMAMGRWQRKRSQREGCQRRGFQMEGRQWRKDIAECRWRSRSSVG